MKMTTLRSAHRGGLALVTALTLAWSTGPVAAANEASATKTALPLTADLPGSVRARQPSSCPVPKGLVVSSITSTGASVHVAETTAEIPGYTVVYVAMQAHAQPVFRHVTALPLALTELRPGTTYTISVQAKCAGGSSLGNITTTFTTLARPRPLPAHPQTTAHTVRPIHDAALLAEGSAASTSSSRLLTQPNGQGPSAGPQLYPNPATGSVTVVLPAGSGSPALGVELLNPMGQRVRAYEIAPRAANAPAGTVLDLTGLAAGVYSLQLDTPEGPISKRLVVE